jgi:iron-sulfur cluster repair protein YtfE (RIC family)
MGTPRPSSVRTCMLEQHRALAEKLDHVQQAAAALAAAGHASVERAIALGHELCREIAEHIEIEDRLLVPALRDVDAWGEIRAQQLSQKHGQTQQELQALQLDEHHCPLEPCALAARLIAVIEALRADMMREQQGLLTPEVLRDDVLGIDVEDG